MPQIKTLLASAADSLHAVSDSALLDAEILLCTVLGIDRPYLRAWPDRTLNPEQVESFQALLYKRQQGKPIAYLTGIREFWSRDFNVSPDVLIPRPDTETLVELSLALIPKNQPRKIIDLGTGSGIIAITIAAERPCAQVFASDISEVALQIAKANAIRHNVDNIQFYQSNWFETIPTDKFDLIVSNPPYIAKDDPHLLDGDLRHEPKTALIAADNGMADLRTIAEAARHWLEADGHLLVEHGYNQKEDVQRLLQNLNYQAIQTYADLAGQARVTSGQYRPSS